MQSLDVISVNIWQILISLLNLLILFLLMKKFLFKRVKDMLTKRQEEIEAQYKKAEASEMKALENKNAWEEKLASADAEADKIMQEAVSDARFRGDQIVNEAQSKADSIMKKAETDAALELQKAEASIKEEIVNVSTALAEKMLGREIKEDDHHSLIDSFIGEIGEDK